MRASCKSRSASGTELPFPLQPGWQGLQVRAIRFWLDSETRLRDRATLDLATDGKLRGCDSVKITIGDTALGRGVRSRAAVVQQKRTGI